MNDSYFVTTVRDHTVNWISQLQGLLQQQKIASSSPDCSGFSFVRAEAIQSGLFPVNGQLDAQFFSYMFLSIICMFRATSCSSSGESIVSIQHLVYVTLCPWPSSVQVGKELSDLHTRRSPTQNDVYQMYWYNWFSWWWARGCSKHVENWKKHRKRIVRQVGHLPELYRDARSTKYKIQSGLFPCRVPNSVKCASLRAQVSFRLYWTAFGYFVCVFLSIVMWRKYILRRILKMNAIHTRKYVAIIVIRVAGVSGNSRISWFTSNYRNSIAFLLP